jgi:hypothetical protein
VIFLLQPKLLSDVVRRIAFASGGEPAGGWWTALDGMDRMDGTIER